MSATRDSSPSCSIVADGPERLAAGIRKAVLPEIRLGVESEFADRLAGAAQLSRFWIRWQIEAEIERRVDEEISKQFPSEYALF